MLFGKRKNLSGWNLAWCCSIVLLTGLLVLMGCSEDCKECPMCPEPSVETSIVPYISYFDVENKDLMVAKKIGDSWGIKIVDFNNSVGRYTSIAIDAQSNAHVSYHEDTHFDLKYAVETENGWLIEEVDAEGNTGHRTSITLDRQGNPHISYRNHTDNIIKYAHKLGGSWEKEKLENVPAPFSGECISGDWGQPTSLVVDDDGIPHICYYSGDRGGSLIYARRPAGSMNWSSRFLDDAGNVGIGCSMVLDTHGNQHISYCEYKNNVRYIRKANGEWTDPEIVPGPISSGNSHPTSLALDTGGNPHIAYYTVSGTLAYAVRTASGDWLYEIVDDFGDVGADCSLALDTEGNPHISYWNVTTLDLMYAVKCNGYWIIESADPWGQKGEYTSIAIGSQ